MLKNNCYLSIKLFCLAVFSFPYLVFSQSILDQYVQEGINHNLVLQGENYDLAKQELIIAEAKARKLPQISTDAFYLLSVGGRSINIPAGDLVNPINSTLNQLTGGNNFPTNIENEKERLSPNNFYDVRARLKYPIFNRPIYYGYLAQKKLISVEQAQIETAKTVLAEKIKTSYYNYFKIEETIGILNNNLSILYELLTLNQKLVKHQKLTPYAVVRVEYEVERLKSSIVNVKQQQLLLKNNFNTLLNKDIESDIDEEPLLKTQIQELLNSSPDLEELKEAARQKRSELSQIEHGIGARKALTELEEKKLLPTVGLEVSAGLQGIADNFSADHLIGTVGVGFNWLIYDGKQRKLRVEQSNIASQKLENDLESAKQQIELQVINAYYTLEAQKNVVKTEEKALYSAKKNFEQVRKYYENQKVILIEYLEAQNNFINTQLNVSIAKFDLLVKKAQLDRAINF